MKAKRFAVIEKGKVVTMADCSHERELSESEIPLTTNELALLRACDGNLKLAKLIIRDIETRIESVSKE